MGKLIVSADNGKYLIGSRRSGKRGVRSRLTVEYLACTADTAEMLAGNVGAIQRVDLGLFNSNAEAWDAIHKHQGQLA